MKHLKRVATVVFILASVGALALAQPDQSTKVEKLSQWDQELHQILKLHKPIILNRNQENHLKINQKKKTYPGKYQKEE